MLEFMLLFGMEDVKVTTESPEMPQWAFSIVSKANKTEGQASILQSVKILNYQEPFVFKFLPQLSPICIVKSSDRLFS